MTPVQLPEVPAIARFNVTGDYCYPTVDDQEGACVSYDDHVAQLREYAMAYGVQLLEEFLRMASEPVGLQCCGHGRGECCGEPEPVYATTNEVLNAMNERLAALTTPSETNSER